MSIYELCKHSDLSFMKRWDLEHISIHRAVSGILKEAYNHNGEKAKDLLNSLGRFENTLLHYQSKSKFMFQINNSILYPVYRKHYENTLKSLQNGNYSNCHKVICNWEKQFLKNGIDGGENIKRLLRASASLEN